MRRKNAARITGGGRIGWERRWGTVLLGSALPEGVCAEDVRRMFLKH